MKTLLIALSLLAGASLSNPATAQGPQPITKSCGSMTLANTGKIEVVVPRSAAHPDFDSQLAEGVRQLKLQLLAGKGTVWDCDTCSVPGSGQVQCEGYVFIPFTGTITANWIVPTLDIRVSFQGGYAVGCKPCGNWTPDSPNQVPLPVQPPVSCGTTVRRTLQGAELFVTVGTASDVEGAMFELEEYIRKSESCTICPPAGEEAKPCKLSIHLLTAPTLEWTSTGLVVRFTGEYLVTCSDCEQETPPVGAEE